MKKAISTAVLLLIATGQAFAGSVSSSSSEEALRSLSSASAASVPELDGGFAFIALALTAGIIALIRERKRA